ncbi:unnamed protein product [Eruca vesicaria subsp. sativa]|uniref:BZIP domain-containing protein n=1 Tax=Eruca vesicaria subsp. sativa TaxID=29727 RepID=A0ABC8KDV5_ERUVS|nr:unnamed protein product [Eruca vesicaria subsp. sativa]
MESSVHRSHHCFDIFEGMPPQDDHLNSAFLPNATFHVHLQSPNLSTRSSNNNNNRFHIDPNGENVYEGLVPDERRAKRMVSNRDSARRARMRKKSCSNK